MGLSDIFFIIVFTLIFVPLYYLLPIQSRKYLLLVGSFIFYAFNDILIIPVLLANIFLAFVLGLLISITKQNLISKILLFLGIAIQVILMILSVIAVNPLKVTAICEFCGIDSSYIIGILESYNITYHAFIGIGFMTVQIIGYYHNAYKEPDLVSKNLLSFYNYILFFPKILQGPITEYKDMEHELNNPSMFSSENLERGMRIFILGMSMKVLIADRLSFLWNGIQTIGFESLSTPLAWLSMYSYSMQLYLDFQGYSLMAIGIALMLGFTLPSNFRHPYMSQSIGEFYRRWHATLGTWFKNHIYIPCGGSRKGTTRTIINLALVWIATGLWHGLTINYMIWAMFLLLFIILEKTLLQKFFNCEKLIAKIFRHIYVLLVIPFSWMFFAISDVPHITIYFQRLFGILSNSNAVVDPNDYIKYFESYGVYLIAGLLCCFPFIEDIFIKSRVLLSKIILFVLFWASIYMVVKNGNNQFMYVNF